MTDKNHHFGGRGVHATEPAYGVPAHSAAPPPPPPPPPRTVVLGHELSHRDGLKSSSHRVRRSFAIGEAVTPAEACAMVQMLRRHGYTVDEPTMQVGAPMASQDAEAIARVLVQHGYRVSPPRRSKRRRRAGGFVGFARALTGKR